MANTITPQNIMQEIYNPQNWKLTGKKSSYTVYVCKPKLGTKVYNKLEGAHYETNSDSPYVISGTRGEMWIIKEAKLLSTYCFVNDKPITSEELRRREKEFGGLIDWMHLKPIDNVAKDTNFALQLPLSIQNFPVQTSWATLYANRLGVPHGKGDFLLCSNVNGMPDINNTWVVNGEVFPDTYARLDFQMLKWKNRMLIHVE